MSEKWQKSPDGSWRKDGYSITPDAGRHVLRGPDGVRVASGPLHFCKREGDERMEQDTE